MAALAAMLADSPFAQTVEHPRERGKPCRLVAIAMARKLFVIANALLRDEQPFNPRTKEAWKRSGADRAAAPSRGEGRLGNAPVARFRPERAEPPASRIATVARSGSVAVACAINRPSPGVPKRPQWGVRAILRKQRRRRLRDVPSVPKTDPSVSG